MTLSTSRRQVLCSLPPTVLAMLSGCTSIFRGDPQPARFEIRPEAGMTLRLVASSNRTGEEVHNQSRSFTSGEVLVLDKETLQNPPYDLVLNMDGQTIWEAKIGTCNDLVVAVSSKGEVETITHTAC